jgi:H/ACA ribonucleoprotein complex non-core subunit NAF1
MATTQMDLEKMDLDVADTSISEDVDNSIETPELASNDISAVPHLTISTPSIVLSTEHVPIAEDAGSGDIEASPALTGALEALLGGLDPPTPIALEVLADIAKSTIQTPHSLDAVDITQTLPHDATLISENDPNDITMPEHDTKDITMPENDTKNITMPEANDTTDNVPVTAVPIVSIPEGSEMVPPHIEQSTISEAAVEEQGEQEEHPEWEVDLSPIESSSDDSSSDDSSSDESEEGENAYKLLSPEEQARILMQEEGGSDDENGGKGTKGTGTGYRTKNEVPEVVISKPDVTITEDMPIKEIGNVENVIDNIVLIKAKTSGEYQVLESGSVLCLENRSVIGAVSETIGRVQQPFYSVLFTNATELAEAGLEVGTKVFYPEQHATFVFTQALKAYKGSDASNLHDEEVGADEMEFSDDEAEAEHKRKIKQARLDRRGGRNQQNGGSSRGGHHPLQQSSANDPSKGISYDDAEDDGPYRPLSRPAGFASSNGHSEAPQEGQYIPQMNGQSQPSSRGQSRGRGRGDRGRGRGDRGRGRVGHQNERRGGGSNGYSQPPQGHQKGGPAQSPTAFQQPQFLPQAPYQARPKDLSTHPSFGSAHYPPGQPQMLNSSQTPSWPNFAPQPPFQPPPFQQPFPNMPNMPHMSNMPNSSNIPGLPNMPNMSNGWPPNPAGSGAYVNPAFFGNNPPGNQNYNSWPQNQGGQGGGRQ